MNWKFSSLAIFLAIIFLFLASPRPVLAACGTKPGAAQNLTADNPTYNGALLHWSDPTWNCQQGTSYYFKIILGAAARPPVNNQDTVYTTVASSGQSYTYDASKLNLASNTTYYWYPRPCYMWKGSEYCSINTTNISFTTLASCTPTAPNAFTLSSPTSGSTVASLTPTLSWNATSNFNDCGTTTYYEVFGNGYQQTTTSNTSYVTGTLAYSTTYTWAIKACNSSGAICTDSSSGTWSFTTPAAPCTSSLPTVPTASPTPTTGITTTGATANWLPPTTWGSCSPSENSYSVTLYDGATNLVIKTDSLLTSLSDNFTGLTAGHSYYWTVMAHNNAGNSPPTAHNNFQTTTSCTVTQFPPVLAAGGLTTTNITYNSATANWSGSALPLSVAAWNSCDSTKDYYKFTDPNGTVTNTVDWGVTTNSFSGLAYGINYTWSIIACDSDIGCNPQTTTSPVFTPTPPAACAP